MSLGRLSIFPNAEIFSTIGKIFFVREAGFYCTKRAHLRLFSHSRQLLKHGFARLCAGNCKPTRTSASLPQKDADLARIPRHQIYAP
jgi:hypothetical protein